MTRITGKPTGFLASDPGLPDGVPEAVAESYTIEKAVSGEWSFKYKAKQFISKYDPAREAQRSAALVKADQTANFVFFGFGMGYFVREVLKRFVPRPAEPKPVVLILEENPEIAKISLELEGMDILSRFETHLLQRQEQLLDFYLDRSFVPLSFNPSVLAEIEFYRNAYNLTRLISVNNSTKHKFRRLILRNSVRNSRQMSGSVLQEDLTNIPGIPGISGVSGFSARSDPPDVRRMSTIPGVVVAAGPSLDRDIADLKKAQGRCVIASSDTALPVLLKSGIIPHFVVTGDPQVISYGHFYACRKELEKIHGAGPVGKSGIPLLVSDITASPLILPLFGFRHVYISTGSPISDMIERKLPFIRMGGSITAGAFFFLFSLGIRKIYFTGQDYGNLFDRTHCAGTLYEHYLLQVNTRLMSLGSRQARMHYPGSVRFSTDSGPLWTTPLLVSYCEWLKSEIEGLEGTEVVNTSDRSLFMSGSIRRGSLKELADAEILAQLPAGSGGPGTDIAGLLGRLLDGIKIDAGKITAMTTAESADRIKIGEVFGSSRYLGKFFKWFYPGRERYFDPERFGPERFDENIRLLSDLCRDLV